jgi:hypothetical protein
MPFRHGIFRIGTVLFFAKIYLNLCAYYTKFNKQNKIYSNPFTKLKIFAIIKMQRCSLSALLSKVYSKEDEI